MAKASTEIVAIRKGAAITMVDTGKVQQYPFINQAKRASTELQKIHGLGSVRRG